MDTPRRMVKALSCCSKFGIGRKRVQTEKTFVEYQLASRLFDPVSISTSPCAKKQRHQLSLVFLKSFLLCLHIVERLRSTFINYCFMINLLNNKHKLHENILGKKMRGWTNGNLVINWLFSSSEVIQTLPQELPDRTYACSLLSSVVTTRRRSLVSEKRLRGTLSTMVGWYPSSCFSSKNWPSSLRSVGTDEIPHVHR